MARLDLNRHLRRTAFGAVIGTVGMVAFSAAAGAVTLTADFDFSGSGYAWSPSYTIGDLTVDVTGYNYTAQDFDFEEGNSVTLLNQIGVSLNTNGLGGCSAATEPSDTNCGTRPQLDGQVNPELLQFSFSQAVTITGILFANNDQNDLVDIFIGDNLEYVVDSNTPLPPDRLSLAGFGPILNLGVGNQTFSDQYRIASISVSYEMIPPPPPPNPVPLPAAGWMLLAGLGGLTAMRRRRRK